MGSALSLGSTGLGLSEIAALAQDAGDNRVGQTLRGWATVKAKAVRDLPPLRVEWAEPPKKHGVIVGWPDESQQVRALAMALSKIATTIRFPQTPAP